MRKKLNNDRIIVKHSDSFSKLNIERKLPYPFDKKLICLLKNENKFPQEYYYIERDTDYAFFILYKNKTNIFTFGRLKYFVNLNIIGFPCSLSNSGYITNNEQFMLDYIKTIKGAKLILNVQKPLQVKNMTLGETLPTCIFKNNFLTIDEYLNSLRSGHRRRINIAIKHNIDIKIKELNDNSIDIYNLYLNTYNKSNYKLEKLEKGFFDKIEAKRIIFIKDNKPLGFVLLKQEQEKLIFMLCGMDYKFQTADLYYYMLFNIIKYAIKQKCKTIDFGQTSEETKMKFGALIEKRYFYAHHTNPLLNYFVKLAKGILEYKYNFQNYKVFKEETK